MPTEKQIGKKWGAVGATPHETERKSVALNANTDQQQDFYNLPTSPATRAIWEVMTMGKDAADMMSEERKAKTTTKTPEQKALEALHDNYEPVEPEIKNTNMRTLTFINGKSKVTLQITDINKLAGSNKGVKKIFLYALVKLNEQAYSDGVFKRDFIEFPLQDLVELGCYNTIQSARVGFRDAQDILTSIKFSGELVKGKTIKQDGVQVLFTGATRNDGVCHIDINPKITWGMVAAFYTILPKWAFGLSNKALDLLFYIANIARQRKKNIEEDGRFTISMKAVQKTLCLPNIEDTKNPRTTIKGAIVKAIEEIEDAIAKEEKEKGIFTITPIAKNSKSIAEYLNNGYLDIRLAGKYKEHFAGLSEVHKKQIQTAQKRKDAIQDRAKAINLAKRMEQEEQQQKTE